MDLNYLAYLAGYALMSILFLIVAIVAAIRTKHPATFVLIGTSLSHLLMRGCYAVISIANLYPSVVESDPVSILDLMGYFETLTALIHTLALCWILIYWAPRRSRSDHHPLPPPQP